MRFTAPLLGVLAVVAIAVVACGDDEGAVSTERKSAVAEHYADIVYASYGASIRSAGQMQAVIGQFLATPTQARLNAARKAWIVARDDYILTEPFRFYGGPIDDPKTGPEGLINAWPMDEVYVDYVRGEPRAGIVNDRSVYPRITADAIVEANEKGGETNISSGWHAIEFLLWGQDRSTSGPGARPASDYTSAPNAARRATYLRLTTQRLLSDLRSVRDPWAPLGAYRKTFLADPDRALTSILRGIGTLNSHELAGERMAVALDSRDQEDEHSCFSDNTNADVVNDLKGIRMVYLGEGSGGSGGGVSLDALVRDVDAELATALRAKLDATLAAARAFPATFERMIAAPEGSAEHTAISDVIASIEAQGTDLAKAATALGVKVNFEA